MPAPTCPYCKSAARAYLRTRDVNRRISEESFDYYRCTQCGLIFLAPIPTDLARYYPSDYYTLAASADQMAQWAEHERYKLDIVRRFADGGRLLEIGPASGGFALLAKRAGFEVEAIEMSGECCRFLNEVLQVRAIHATNEIEAMSHAKDADVIALWHVIEHLGNPWAMLEAAAVKLRPNGVLIVAAPNPDAFQFRMLRGRWAHVDAPRHVCLIPAPLIEAKMKTLGMTPVLRTTRDTGSLGWNTFGWEFSLASFFDSRLLRRVARKAGRTLARLLAPIESREGQGSAYTVALRKVAS
jgi:2-polyprenyl-3-methyl-5-hydroxy-6-metoxy-1,4-benzoquinol methylase